jgi:1-deoxy-D-xylulose-5-phosphate reductoisomerase
MQRAYANDVTILPMDSEHNALFQVFSTAQKNQIEKLILTASGGAFLSHSHDEIYNAGVADALNHPNWAMGQKVTVDSAGLMNKGFELIEACHLFDMPENKVDVVIHPQSIIHSMVSYYDGSVLAQMGLPDMRTPIAYALSYPERVVSGVNALDFVKMGDLTFLEPDLKRFPALQLCRDVYRNGGSDCAVLNASNEVAVDMFLQEKISCGQICETVNTIVNTVSFGMIKDLSDFVEIDTETRVKTQELINAKV